MPAFSRIGTAKRLHFDQTGMENTTVEALKELPRTSVIHRPSTLDLMSENNALRTV